MMRRWRPVTPKLKDKVLVPVLGDQYGNVLLAGDLVLQLDEARGEVGVRYFEHWFPLDPATYPSVFDPSRGAMPASSGAERTAAIEIESVMRALQALPPHGSSGAAERTPRRSPAGDHLRSRSTRRQSPTER